MNFWDSSALLPLLVKESNSESTRRFIETESEVAIWWATPVECISALARKEREGKLVLPQMIAAERNLDLIVQNCVIVDATDRVRLLARRLLRRHPLRAADSLQLAAASTLAGEMTTNYGFVSNDERLKIAASKEGFSIVNF